MSAITHAPLPSTADFGPSLLVKRVVIGMREDGEAIWADANIPVPDGFQDMSPPEQRAALAKAEQPVRCKTCGRWNCTNPEHQEPNNGCA